jgi:hypothetical protein
MTNKHTDRPTQRQANTQTGQHQAAALFGCQMTKDLLVAKVPHHNHNASIGLTQDSADQSVTMPS